MADLSRITLPSGTTYDIVDSTAVHSLDGYATTGDVTAATSALAEAIAEQGYQTSGDVQNAISGKADTSAVTEAISAATSGKVDTSTFNTYTGNVATELSTKFAGVNYNSTDKKIYFYDNASNTGTALTYVDATDFIKDGMVDNVEIKDVTLSGETVTCLVITFNTDSGKEEIDIPISDIFDASNYYTKAEIDSTVSGLTARMSEDEEVTAAGLNALNETVSGKVDTTTFNTYSGSVATALAGKQDTLVSGTNIKTVGGNSLLGSGDVPFPPGMTAEVSGTTLIFS